MRIILDNDVDRMNKVLDGFQLDDKLESQPISRSICTVARLMLGFASATSYRGECDPMLAETLIRRTAKVINIFNFISLTLAATGIKPEEYDLDDVPMQIRQIIGRKWVDKDIVTAIQTMGRQEFLTLLVLLHSDEISSLKVGYSLPIIERVRKEKLLPNNLFLAYMADAQDMW